MFVPFISTPSPERRELWKRKGGGGRGGGSSSSGKGGSGSSSGSTAGRSVNVGGTSKSASRNSNGVSTVTFIPNGGLFVGRTQGGGTRSGVYGGNTYGSGYPGVSTTRGTAGYGFPYFFWPVAFVGGAGGGYYYHNREYGNARNDSRPGGAQLTAAFQSSSLPTTYRLLADNVTVTSLIEDIVSSCGSQLSSTSITPTAYQGDDVDYPKPEQIVQYYRASSVALGLDGYNNTGIFSEDENTPSIPLPQNIDTNLLACLNTTIGENVPLVDSAFSLHPQSGVGLMGVVGLVWAVLSMM